MIRHAWSVLCHQVLVDDATKNVTLSVLETLWYRLPSVPLVQPPVLGFPFALVSLWHWEGLPQPFSYSIQLVSPSGVLMGQQPVNVARFSPQSIKIRTTVRYDGLPYAGYGKYTFRVMREAGGFVEGVAEIPLIVDVPPHARHALP